MTDLTLSHAITASAVSGPSPLRRAWVALLRIPLVLKLLGANVLLALLALVLVSPHVATTELALAWLVLTMGFAVNALLVRVALFPLDEFERVAHAVAGGDVTARVSVLPTADSQLSRLAEAFNALLARAASDRAQIQHLVRESLRARETERLELARQLRDSTAQELAGMSMQLAAAVQVTTEPKAMANLEAAREIASRVSNDVRLIADSVYPGLLGRFGLYPALEAIARRTRERTGLDVVVHTDEPETSLPLGVTMALHGVAEEAMRNVEKHSSAKSVRITLGREGAEVQLTIEDDGVGFDPDGFDHPYKGIGLFRARELLAHAGGELSVLSAPGHGTKVIATALVGDLTA